MYNKFFSLGIILMFSIFVSACVMDSTYNKKVADDEQQIQSLQKQYNDLTAENNILKGKISVLTEDRDQLKEAFVNTTKDKERVTLERDELDKVLQSKSDALSKNISDLRKKNSDLYNENEALKRDVVKIETEKKKKEEEIQSVKKTQDDLLQEMKAEVAKGQITITELKGKLTLDVVEHILFDSGETEVKPEGLAVLQRVIDVLKKLKDKNIRIEGHTDNIQIKGNLAKKYPTNWELSAARAINVTRYLQKQGIDPLLLSASAYGEYKSVASNSTAEGRAKNRRIAIILLPKD